MKKRKLKLPRWPVILMIVVVAVLVVGALYALFGYRLPSHGDVAYKTAPMTLAEINQRRERILAIYASLGLGPDYVQTSEDIFGEKRIYSWDNGRSYSSSRTYVRQADVNKTAEELNVLILRAGFTYVGEPYPGAVDVQIHYKSPKGEYLRMTVSSKPRDDAIRAAARAKKEPNYDKLPYRDGPSNVIIKVNLDDNNE